MRLGLATVLIILAGACAPSDDTPSASLDGPDTQGVVDVIARGLTLIAPDEIPSGWTTFRFSNESPMIHFVLVERVPDGQGIESQQAQVAPVFQDGLDLLGAGEVDAALERFGDLPAWFGEIVFLGGTNEMPAGTTSYFTVVLEPGNYAWVSEVPGSAEKGMLKPFTVPSGDD